MWRKLTRSRWDSSDPERAPPPLPLNPQSPSFSSRAGTSTAIQTAHAALGERARESAALVPALARRMNDGSPEKALVKASHRRMQSLQPVTVRDLSLMLESPRPLPQSPGRSSDRPSTPTHSGPREGSFEPRANDHAAEGPTPTLTPVVRPAVRRPATQSILGENTPPQSSTMLALQTMGARPSSRDGDPAALSNITKSASVPKGPHTLEGLSAQILSLTNIAQSLKKDLTQLSRRSKDNATDLLSLKEATSTRDEDIRRGLRGLMGNMSETSSRITSREHFGGLFIDSKPHCASPSNGRAFHLPRVPLPKSFADSVDGASVSTPSLSGGDGAASVALLDKILRGLGTKDGHESLLELLKELSGKVSGMATAAKVDELAQLVREQSESAIVPDVAARCKSPGQEGTIQRCLGDGGALNHRVQRLLPGGESRRSSAPPGRGAELLDEDLIKNRRQSQASVSSQKTLVDYQEIYNAMRAALRDNEASRGDMPDLSRDDVIRAVRDAWEDYKPEIMCPDVGLEREDVLTCLNEGLQEYMLRDEKPAGATREVFKAVVEGLKHFVPPQMDTTATISRDEIIEAVRDCLEEFEFPVSASAVANDMTRSDMVHAVKEGLEGLDLSRSDALVAHPNADEVLARLRDISDHLKAGFQAVSEEAKENVAANGRDTEQVLDATNDGLENLRAAIESYVDRATGASGQQEFMENLVRSIDEFKEEMTDLVSEVQARDSPRDERDTEHILDATKDGLENLRVAIEGYVDRVAEAHGPDEITDGISRAMEELKDHLAQVVSQANDGSRQQLQTELSGLREIVNSSMVPASPQPSNSQEVVDALHDGLSSLRQEILRPRPETNEILDALHEGLNELHIGIDRVTNKPVDLTANDEIMDALKSGLDSVRAYTEALRDSSNDRAVAAVTALRNEAPENAIVPADMIKQDDIKNLEVLITQLRIKVEAMEPPKESEHLHQQDLARLEQMLRDVQERVNDISSREPPAPAEKEERDASPAANGDAATKEDVEVIETILRNIKALLDDMMDGEQAVRKEHLDVAESLALETRETLGSVADQLGDVCQKQDLAELETLIGQVSARLDETKGLAERDAANDDKATKTDVEAVETVVLEMKTMLDGLAATDFASFSNKDISGLQTAVKEAAEKLGTHAESSTKALDDRQAEIVGVADRVTDVKAFLEEFQETIKSRLEEGSSDVEALSKLVQGMGETVTKNENVGSVLEEMLDTMKTQFDDSKEVIAAARLESNEKLQEATESIGTKIDDKMAELMATQDEFKAAVDERNAAGEAREVETEAAVFGTKAVAEEVKLLIDTLGSTVTDSLEKMEEASKTVFAQVEQLASRAEENHTDGKTEHQQTRDQVQQTTRAVEELQGKARCSKPSRTSCCSWESTLNTPRRRRRSCRTRSSSPSRRSSQPCSRPRSMTIRRCARSWTGWRSSGTTTPRCGRRWTGCWKTSTTTRRC